MSFSAVNHPIAITDLPLESDSPVGSRRHHRQLQLLASTTSVPVGATGAGRIGTTFHTLVVSTGQFKSRVLDTDERFSFASAGRHVYFSRFIPR